VIVMVKPFLQWLIDKYGLEEAQRRYREWYSIK
jgi:hypothetical protein